MKTAAPAATSKGAKFDALVYAYCPTAGHEDTGTLHIYPGGDKSAASIIVRFRDPKAIRQIKELLAAAHPTAD